MPITVGFIAMKLGHPGGGMMSVMYALVFLGGFGGPMSLAGLSEKSLMSMSSSVTTSNCSRDPGCLSVSLGELVLGNGICCAT